MGYHTKIQNENYVNIVYPSLLHYKIRFFRGDITVLKSHIVPTKFSCPSSLTCLKKIPWLFSKKFTHFPILWHFHFLGKMSDIIEKEHSKMSYLEKNLNHPKYLQKIDELLGYGFVQIKLYYLTLLNVEFSITTWLDHKIMKKSLSRDKMRWIFHFWGYFCTTTLI